jgi:DNA-binding MarR family transcriptional regulator
MAESGVIAPDHPRARKPIVTGASMPPLTIDTSDPSTVAIPTRVSAGLERSLTQVARTILRLDVPADALPGGASIGRTGYWLLVLVSEKAPLRLSDLAGTVELDLSTISRQIRDLVASGLITRKPDPADGRAALLSLTDQGVAVLEAVSEFRRRILAEAIAEWTDDERNSLASGLLRLGAGLHPARDSVTENVIDIHEETR